MPNRESPHFRIRPAAGSDADAILTCLRLAFAPYQDRYTPDGFRDTVLSPETITGRLSSMKVFVAETDSGEVIGTISYARVSEQEGHIRGMAVDPDWQGRGVAEELLRKIESELAAGGCSRVSLDTTQPLQRAMRFYEKNGYRLTGTVRDFFGMPLYEYAKVLR